MSQRPNYAEFKELCRTLIQARTTLLKQKKDPKGYKAIVPKALHEKAEEYWTFSTYIAKDPQEAKLDRLIGFDLEVHPDSDYILEVVKK